MSEQPVIDIEPAPGSTPKEANELELVLQKSGLDNEGQLMIRTGFADFLAQAEKWKIDVPKITDAKIAGDTRKGLKKIRVAAEKKRLEMKKKVAVVTDTIQEAYDIVEGITLPLEAQLEEIEKKAEKEAAAKKEALKAERLAALTPYGVDTEFIVVEEMTNEKFAKYLADSKLVFETRAAEQAKLDEAKRLADEKAAADAKAKADAEAIENERIRIENDRLKREKEAADKKAKDEEEARELAWQAEKEKAEKERQSVQAELDRANAETALAKKKADEAQRASLAALEAEKSAANEKVRLAQEQARKEQEALLEAARKERLEHEAALKVANDAKAKLEADQRALVTAQQTQTAADEHAKAMADGATNNEKLRYLAEDIRSLTIPELTGANGEVVRKELVTQIDLFARWVEKKGSVL